MRLILFAVAAAIVVGLLAGGTLREFPSVRLQHAWLALGGVVLGAVAALALNRFVAGFLYGIAPTDVLTYGAVMLLLLIVAAAASYQPARTATRTDPLVALRHE